MIAYILSDCRGLKDRKILIICDVGGYFFVKLVVTMGLDLFAEFESLHLGFVFFSFG